MSEAAAQLPARATALLQPISAGSPAGDNAQYDERYEAVRAEVGKLDLPSAGEVQWGEVVAGAEALLGSTTKDLLLSTYLAYGLYETEGLSGLATGLAVVGGLVNDYWESMYPPMKRMRGRVNALDWLWARLETALPGCNAGAADRPALDAVLAAFARLDEAAQSKLGEAASSAAVVRRALAAIDGRVPRGEGAPAANVAPAANAAAAPAPSGTPDGAAPGTAAATGDAATTSPATATGDAATPGNAAASGDAAAGPPATSGDAATPGDAATSDAATSTPAPGDAPAGAEATPPTPPEPVGPDAEAKKAAQQWLEPIAGDAPTGGDARYEPEYEAMRTEVGKLDAISGGEVNWLTVEKAASTILTDKSKDVLAACYLGFARYQQAGLDGLMLALAIVGGLFETFESDRWPSRERGQFNAVSWFTEQLERALANHKPKPDERETLVALKDLMRATGGIMRRSFDNEAPSFARLEERMQRMLLAVPEKKPDPPPPPPKPTPTPTATPTPAAAPAAPAAPMPTTAEAGSAEEVGKYLLETGRAMVKAANLLRRANVADPTAYRLLRQGLYLHIATAPPADAGGKTQIPPLPPARRQQFETIAANAKWAALIEETESALGQFRFVLDLHRMTVEALEGMGHTDAANVVVAELRGLLGRLPTWPDLQSADGSPLADGATRDWLAEAIATGGGGGGSAHADDGEDAAAMTEARKLLAGGKAPEALKLAQASVEAAGHPRHRFVRRLALAEMCLGGGQHRLAKGVFASLADELDSLGISEWEPTLAARCLAGMVRAVRTATQKGAPHDPAADRAFERLCRLDPATAAQLAKP